MLKRGTNMYDMGPLADLLTMGWTKGLAELPEEGGVCHTHMANNCLAGHLGARGIVCKLRRGAIPGNNRLSTITCLLLDMGSYNWRQWMSGYGPSSWHSQPSYPSSLLYMSGMCCSSSTLGTRSPSPWDWLQWLWLVPQCASYVCYRRKGWVLIWPVGLWCDLP